MWMPSYYLGEWSDPVNILVLICSRLDYPKELLGQGSSHVWFYFSVPVTKVLEQREEFWPVISSGFQLFSNIVFSLYCKN